MPINVSASSGSKSDPVPAGTHHAVCYGVVAVGTQPSQQYTPRPKVVVALDLLLFGTKFVLAGAAFGFPRPCQKFDAASTGGHLGIAAADEPGDNRQCPRSQIAGLVQAVVQVHKGSTRESLVRKEDPCCTSMERHTK